MVQSLLVVFWERKTEYGFTHVGDEIKQTAEISNTNSKRVAYQTKVYSYIQAGTYNETDRSERDAWRNQ